MKKNYLLWLGLGVVAAGVIVYFAFFRKKKKLTAPTTATAIDEIDWTALEKTFSASNPYTGDKVKKIEEISPIGENDSAPHPLDPDKVKIKITKSQFESRVLSEIKNLIRTKSDKVRDINSRLNNWWEVWSRAGVNDSLARALAYDTRYYFASQTYYDEAGTPTNTALTPQTPTNTPPPTTNTPTPPPSNSTGGLTAQRYTY